MGFIIRQEEAWLQSRQSPVSKSTVPAQCQQRVSRFSIRCKVEFITSKRWLSSSIDLPKDSTRLASRSIELSFLFGCWSYCWDKIRWGGEGDTTYLVGCTSRYLQGSFCSLQDWQAALPSHFCFRLRHSSHACEGVLANEKKRERKKKRGALCPSENLLLPYVWPFVGAVHGWG